MDGVFNATALLQDLLAWMTGLVPIGGGLMVGYHALAKNSAQDEQQAAGHARSIRNVLIGTAIGTGSTALINFLLGYVG